VGKPAVRYAAATILGLAAIAVAMMIMMKGQNEMNDSKAKQPGLPAEPSPAASQEKAEAPPVFRHVSVHDPSVVKDGDTYYVFGSHIDGAKSTDLMQWTKFTNGYTKTGNALYGELSANLAESFAWAGENDSDSKGGYAVWAPEVLWNEHYVNEDGTKGAYMLYYSASSTYIRSAIGLAVSSSIEGPYRYVDTIVYSGFTKEEQYDADSRVNKRWSNTNIAKLISNGTVGEANENWFHPDGSYNNSDYPNAIDANLVFDAEGKLWMSYGSWSGGIFLLEIDKETGRAIYPGVDGETADGRMIDRYFGVKIAGGYTKSGEGPYIVYDKDAGWYYLYLSYGWLGSDGGYNMRQFRSERIDGPYVDASGHHAILQDKMSNFLFGNKIMGNFLFKDGDAGRGYGYVSPGHNSVYADKETGRQFLVFHTRFPGRGERHEVRVHQMFMNRDGWPVAAAYPYSGETLEPVSEEEIAGSYKLIDHGKDYSAQVIESVDVSLNEDGTIGGAVSGAWKLDGDNGAEITVGDAVFRGVFIRLWDPQSSRRVMTFTALSGLGTSIWGSKSDIPAE